MRTLDKDFTILESIVIEGYEIFTVSGVQSTISYLNVGRSLDFDPEMTSKRPFMNFMTEILMIKADSTDISGHIINQLTQYNSMFSDSWLPDNIFLYVSLRLSRLAFWPILETPGMIDTTSTTLGSYAEN